MIKCKICKLLEENCTCFTFLPDDGLTPKEAIEALERRFELGAKNYGSDAWNAFTNRERLDDMDWIENRCDHARWHIAHFLEVMDGLKEDNGDDDGAAIMWLGAMLHMAYERRKKLAK